MSAKDAPVPQRSPPCRPPAAAVTVAAMSCTFDHVHLHTTDLAGALEFYQNTMGAEPVGILPNSHGGENHLIVLGGQFLVLSDYPPGFEPEALPAYADGRLARGHGVAHLGINVDKLEPILARLAAAGVEVHGSPKGSGAIRFVYFTAPDGVVIELTQYVLPPKLKPVVAALSFFNRGVHRARWAIGKALVKGAKAS